MFFRKIMLLLTALVLICGFSVTVHALSYTFTTIDQPGYSETWALGINNAGTVVGRSKDSSGDFHGFVYNGSFSTLDLPGHFNTQPMGINDAGKIVGMSYDSKGGIHHSFLYDGSWSYPIDPPGSNVVDSQAEDINNADEMVGRYWDSNKFFYGYTRVGNAYTILHVPNSGNTLAEGINDAGKVVGTYGDANGTHGFLYNNGVYSGFDSAGSTETRFTDINNADKIVGRYKDGSGIFHGFIYDGIYSTIEVPGATETWVMKINDFDKIVGIYFNGTGMHSFIGTPVVPEPSTIFLFGSGLIGLISFKRKWKK